ncbi:MAG: ATP-binding cassette domain-containing protein, partial [Acidobacteriota bacterium]|nr:ATP-binding cassette domain-containing protein [Acidobacteriota bacterium]
VHDVWKSFGPLAVLKGISLEVPRGSAVALIGPSGSGKSTLLRCINLLEQPERGRVRVGDQVIECAGAKLPGDRELAAFRARTGMVFQEGALFDSLTVRDNVAYQLIQERVPDEEIDRRVREALSFVGLEETFDMFPASLSGGMKRRVAIARALIHRPEFLIYDSPTAGLDPVTSTTIIELIVKQRDVYSTPSLLVTHRLQDAFTMCTHRFDPERSQMVPLPKGQTHPNTTFLMLSEGRLIFDGSLREFVHSDDKFVREFLE